MDVDKMLAELRLERQQIEEAILTLERLARGRGRRRGRPPAWLKDGVLNGLSDDNAAPVFSESPDGTIAMPPAKRRGRPPKARMSSEA